MRDKQDRELDATLPASGVELQNTVAAGSLGTEKTVATAAPVLPVIDSSVYMRGGEIARGGMGRIVEAHDRRLARTVAIKELLDTHSDLAARFEREALISAQLQHPAIVAIYEAGRWPSGEPFYAMKRVIGRSLDKVVAETTMLDQRLALIPSVLAVADALAYAHSKRVIHRDLKPANVLVGEFGETVVIDWGLAKDLSERSDASTAGPFRAAASGETVVGSVMGTPSYMPPEQARGEEVAEPADVYALGALLYHVLGGRPPFSGPTLDTILEAVLTRPPVPLREVVPGVPQDLATIVDKAMAREASERYPTAKELADDLRRFQTGQLVGAHRYSRWSLVRRWIARHRAILAVAAIGLVVTAVIGVVSVQRVIAERDHAQTAESTAERERASAVARSNSLILAQARASLEIDPTAALAWLKKLPADAAGWEVARSVAATARERGVAHVYQALREDVDGLPVAMLSPDGRMLAIALVGTPVELFDLARGTRRTLSPHGKSYSVNTLAFSRDGKRLVAGTPVHGVWEWQVDGSPKGTQISKTGHAANVLADGRIVVQGDGNADVGILDRGSLTELHAQIAKDVITSDDQTTLAAIAKDGVWVFDAAGGERIAPMLDDQPRRIAISNDGALLAAVGVRGRLRVWRTREKPQVILEETVRPNVVSLRWSPTGEQLAIAHGDGMLGLIDPTTKTKREIAAHDGLIYTLRYIPDGSLLASSGSAIRLIDTRTGIGRMLRGHEHPVTFLASGVRVVSLDTSGQIRAWDLTDNRVIAHHVSGATAVCFPDRRRVASTGTDGVVRTFDLATGASRELGKHPVGTVALACGPGGTIASAGKDKTLRLWNGNTTSSVPTALDEPSTIVFAADGSRLAVGAGGASMTGVDLWDVGATTTRRLETAEFIGRPTSGFVFVDRDTLATQQTNTTVLVWDLKTNTSRTLGDQPRAAGSVPTSSQMRAFRDATRIATAANESLAIWNVRDATRQIHDIAETFALAIAPDERSVAIALTGNVVQIRALTGNTNRALRSSGLPIAQLKFSPDGTSLIGAGLDQTIWLWDVASGERRGLRGHVARVNAIDVSSDGAQIVSASSDGTVRLWRDDLPHSVAALGSWLAAATNTVIGEDDRLATGR